MEAQIEHDKNGDVLNGKKYTEDGILIYSAVISENTILETEYFDDGAIKSETIQTTEEEYEDGEEYETIFEEIKEYYKSGELKEQRTYIDGQLENVVKIWDKSGDVILEVNYKDGLIESQNNNAK